MTSGTEHFKCPNCNNKDNIVKTFKKLGVYLPLNDAEWKLSSSAGFYNYGDHHVVTWRCAASTCFWQEGRGYSDVEGVGDWEVVLCDLCGGKGSHLGCWESGEAIYVRRNCGGNGPKLEVRDQSIITIIAREDESRAQEFSLQQLQEII